MTALADKALLATYHAQQTHTWTGNIIRGVEGELAKAGLHSRLERPPAMCFLDITGYTRLTQERGDAAAAAGFPPAHVGLHAGPVVFQGGDYFGQTVNIASRIAEYARPGEVVVSQAVVEASAGVGVRFSQIGPVELKGVAGAMQLHSAQRNA